MTKENQSRLPRVTVVMPSLNQGIFLEPAIQSVLRQDYPNIEFIIMDGGSDDSSLETIKRYAQKLTHWVSQPDAGQSDAINRGWQIGSGDILAWINADDLYEPGVVSEAVKYLNEHPEAGMVCGIVLVVDAIDTDRMIWREEPKTGCLVDFLRNMKSPGTTAAFIRRGALEEVGYLDSSYHYWLDPELWFRIALRWRIGRVRRPWYRFRVHPTSKTAANQDGFLSDQYRIAKHWSEDEEKPACLRKAATWGLTTVRLRGAGHYAASRRRGEATKAYTAAFKESAMRSLLLLTFRWELTRGFIEYCFGRQPLFRRLVEFVRARRISDSHKSAG